MSEEEEAIRRELDQLSLQITVLLQRRAVLRNRLKRPPKSPADTSANRERDARNLAWRVSEMRNGGMTFVEIGKKIGKSAQAARLWCRKFGEFRRKDASPVPLSVRTSVALGNVNAPLNDASALLEWLKEWPDRKLLKLRNFGAASLFELREWERRQKHD